MLTALTDIKYLKGVGEKRAEILRKKGIDTVGALLRYYPRGYLDRRNVTPIAECPFGQNIVVKARVITDVRREFIRAGMTLFKFIAEDESGQMSVTLFNQKFLAQNIREDREYVFYGKMSGSLLLRQMTSPDITLPGAAVIEPLYPASVDLSSKAIEKLVQTALNTGCELTEPLPEAVLKKAELCGINTAIKNIHFPLDDEMLESAKKRLVFEELFILNTGLMFLKKRKRETAGCVITHNELENFKKTIPFSLTNAQERVINECIADMSSGKAMNRLIEGDVGSGKTAVAAALCFTAAKNGFQSALMAPTEILAEQHFKTLCNINRNTGIRCALLTGSISKKHKNEIKASLINGETDVVVGTHALLTDDTQFKNLGLVITDEQHRFGVAQRGKLSAKGNSPHTLVMSATPIPRTLGLIIYGDLDISVIDEYPKGRQVIETYCVGTSYRERIYNYIKKFIDSGRQAYIVCPLVDENEELPITSAEEYFKKLSEGQFKDYRLGLLHGKMPAKEKDSVMRRFSDGEIQLLIATTVIEVGIDVPNAAIMVIENAERFGLSQLHQLRGRIGRGEHKSVCILVSDSRSADTKKRLDVIKNCRDGFKIADEDLKLRGPGDFLGNRQHGLPSMKIADIFSDRETLRLAGREAEETLATDPRLKSPENAGLRQEISALYRKLNQFN